MYKLKRTLCVIIAICFLFLGTSCNLSALFVNLKDGLEDNPTITLPPTQPVTKPKLPDINEIADHQSPYYEKIELTHGYNSLVNDTQRKLYKEIENAVYITSDDIDNNGKYPLDRIFIASSNFEESYIRIALEAFHNDNPQVFWLSNLFGYYIDSYTSTVQLYSDFTSDEIKEMQNNLDTAITSAIAVIADGLNEFDRELVIHDYLLENCVYSDEIKGDAEHTTAFSIYGALVEGSAVCEGYSKAIQYLLSCIGIESYTINGESENELHEWNVVKINNEWYHLDATWNDNDEGIIYDFFNINEETLVYDHIIAKNFTELSNEEICDNSEFSETFNLASFDCNSMEENFYNKKATFFLGLDEQSENSLTTALVYALQASSDRFFIKLDSSLPFEETTNVLFHTEPYMFFACLENANNMFDSPPVDSRAISILSNENQKTIQIYLTYIE